MNSESFYRAWNKTREKYQQKKENKIQLKQAGDHIAIKKNGQKNTQMINMHFMMVVKVMIVEMMIKNYLTASENTEAVVHRCSSK